MGFNKKDGKGSQRRHRINHEIRGSRVRVILEGRNLGVVPYRDAIGLAKERDLDLVQVSPAEGDQPPVCQIIDYGKFCYSQKKKLKQNKTKKVEWKEVRLTPGTGAHDVQTKLRQIRSFLKDGKFVKLTMIYRRRQIAHVDEGERIIKEIIAGVEDLGKVKAPPRMENKRLSAQIIPKSSD